MGDLFDIISSKKIFHANNLNIMNNRKDNNFYPYVVRKTSNNGIRGYINENPQFLNPSNTITFAQDTFVTYYQKEKYFTGNKIKILKPIKEKFKLNNRIAHFIISSINKSLDSISWGTGSTVDSIKDFKLLLPIKNNEIDFDFMESFIADIESQHIAELEAHRMAELHAYLEVTGLSNYELTSKEIDAISQLNNLKIKPFKLAKSYIMRNKKIFIENNGLFNITPTKKKINANSVSFNGSFNYVTRKESENGIRGKIDFDTQYLNDENTISFGQDTATMFYQKERYFTGDKIQILSFNKNYPTLNDKIALFLISTMNKTFSLYSWGAKSFSLESISDEDVYLPVDTDGEIDFNYMETLISAIQKLVIKEVIDNTNNKIEATKKIMK